MEKLTITAFIDSGVQHDTLTIWLYERAPAALRFWCRGYYVDTTGKNTQVIKEYIQNQLKKDKENMQLTIDYPEDPFKGSK